MRAKRFAFAAKFTGCHQTLVMLAASTQACAQRRMPKQRHEQAGRVMARRETQAFDVSDAGGAGGTPDALFELGLMHCTGRDVMLDLVSAHKWFNLAAVRGNEEAKRNRLEISQEMSRSEIAEAQRLAREWLKRH
jgi:uncharacterized protein